MNGVLSLRYASRSRPINLRLLRRITLHLLEDLIHRPGFEIGVSIAGAEEMAAANEKFLAHEGPTDVITFDYTGSGSGLLAGDLMVCIDVAEEQARQFRTSWQSELVRYIVHGVLHLCGYDDQAVAARRKMKKQENALVASLSRRFDFSELAPGQRRGNGARRRFKA